MDPSSTKPTQPSTGVPHSGLFVLMMSLIAVLVLIPLAERSVVGGELLRGGLTVVLVMSVVLARRKPTLLSVVATIALAAGAISWVTFFFEQPKVFVAGCILDSLLFAGVAIWILRLVMLRHLATIGSIFGAISAYLLLGLAWAMLYWGLDRVDPNALDIPNRTMTVDPVGEVSAFSQFVYFSFVTMSTLGYGDITPNTQLSQLLTWTESVVGQFFLAVLVAWLINEMPQRKRHTPESS